jgi:hypothetical protein
MCDDHVFSRLFGNGLRGNLGFRLRLDHFSLHRDTIACRRVIEPLDLRQELILGFRLGYRRLGLIRFLNICAFARQGTKLAPAAVPTSRHPLPVCFHIARHPNCGICRAASCEFRFNPAGDSDLMPATIPI